MGARPVVPYEGVISQYYGRDAEYHNPLGVDSMRSALVRACKRGRLQRLRFAKAVKVFVASIGM